MKTNIPISAAVLVLWLTGLAGAVPGQTRSISLIDLGVAKPTIHLDQMVRPAQDMRHSTSNGSQRLTLPTAKTRGRAFWPVRPHTFRPGDVLRVEYSAKGGASGPFGNAYTLSLQIYGGTVHTIAKPGGLVWNGRKQVLEWPVPKACHGKSICALWVQFGDSAEAGAFFEIHGFELVREQVNNRVDADAILGAPPRVHAEVKELNGAMAIFVNGSPVSGFGWGAIVFAYQSSKYIRTISEGIGFRVFRVIAPLGDSIYSPEWYASSWPGPDEFNFSYIDTQAKRALAANPDGLIILQVILDGTDWWTQRFPELACNRDPKWTKKGIPDYLSEQWRRDSRGAIRQMIAHVQTSPYADRVIGYQLFNGRTMDCNYPLTTRGPRAKRDFAAFLRRRYGQVAELRRAWGMGDVTFGSALGRAQTAPTEVARAKREFALIHNPATDAVWADFWAFCEWQHQQICIDFCRNVKEATHGRLLTGARIGDKVLGAKWRWTPAGMVHDGGGVDLLVREKDLDILEVWEPYPGRNFGDYGSGVPLLPVAGLRAHKKLYMLQNDVRTHLSHPNVGYGRTPDERSTIAKQRRVFVNALTRGTTPYLFQMSYRYNNAAMMADYRKQDLILRKAQQVDRGSGAQVAFVIDEHTANSLGFDAGKTAPSKGHPLLGYPRFLWARAGVPFDMIFLHQLEQFPNYKTYVFFHTIALSAAQRRTIAKVVKRDGKTAVFVWADGALLDRSVDAAAMSDLVGMKVSIDSKAASWSATAEPWFCQLMGRKPGTRIGVLEHQEPYDLERAGALYSPSFAVTDPAVRVIARHADTGTVAVAVKKHPDWTAIYSASPTLRQSVLRYAARLGDAFEYTQGDEAMYITNSFIGIHTKSKRDLDLRLPQTGALFEVFREIELQPSARFSIPVEKDDTYLFFRGDRKMWESIQAR